jgi:Helix-turn-helix domain
MSEQASTIPGSAPSVDSDAIPDCEPGRTPADASPVGSPHASIGRPDSLHVEDQRFVVVPEWVIDADLPDAAFRLYALLLRYGNGTGQRMPSRATLADRLHRSVDAIDRAMRQLADAGMVRVEHRRAGRQNLSNRYHVRTTDPTLGLGGTGERTSAATTDGGKACTGTRAEPVSRRSAATPGRDPAPTPGRTGAVRVAAQPRHDRKISTDTPPPPSPAAARRWRTPEEVAGPELLAACGIASVEDLSRRCIAIRQAIGQPIARWSPQCLVMAIRLAVHHRDWPAAGVVPALLAIAADPATRSPGRLAEAGHWWDTATTATQTAPEDVSDLEQRLDDLGGRRPAIQAQARAELATEGIPLTRTTVTRRASEILDRQQT